MFHVSVAELLEWFSRHSMCFRAKQLAHELQKCGCRRATSSSKQRTCARTHCAGAGRDGLYTLHFHYDVAAIFTIIFQLSLVVTWWDDK